MLVIGLTGGIGSGKSTVSNIFTEFGVPIIDADIVARQVVQPGTNCLQQIAQHFGNTILLENGDLDRKALRKIIFNDENEKKWLEALMHPVIRQEIKHQLGSQSADYCILSSPLLIETHQQELTHRILVVDVDEKTQIDRTSNRDSVPREHVKAIQASQLSRKERLSYANDLIDNSVSLQETHAQVERLHQKYLSLSAEYDSTKQR
ncbi:dephospho-CoA kinase [Teredinibacter sp. KSP-S5-2]|uniref:dephospho-CoA kinase n=1 Tax=Teredinibacter sp. KSP-S5-2 TaxID=3034506 RepID=UPI0029346986|nr:dephospho-CoA kinase [Teredinibacter sp. KSP-S5-2]WNO09630.1 dephospho-CoA kinase [Teredinibacter sp. KSP-S5-2]